jgi:hypothetical protein
MTGWLAREQERERAGEGGQGYPSKQHTSIITIAADAADAENEAKGREYGYGRREKRSQGKPKDREAMYKKGEERNPVREKAASPMARRGAGRTGRRRREREREEERG